MTEAKASYHRILKSTSIIGGASFVNIVISILRTKVLAVLLGPVGVGLASLYNGLMATASTFATMGMGAVGTRQIAEAYSKDDARTILVATGFVLGYDTARLRRRAGCLVSAVGSGRACTR